MLMVGYSYFHIAYSIIVIIVKHLLVV